MTGAPPRRPLSRLLLSVLLLLSVTSWWPSQTSQAQNAAAAKAQKRTTSTPYTGDLSIFDSPGRDQRLQIDRVKDISIFLQEKEWPTLALDQVGSRCALREGWVRRGPCTQST